MADQQPGDTTPAAGMPDPTRLEDGAEPSTVDAPARWSGAAAVVPPEPRKRWWQRPTEPEDDRLATPAVDPWADYDTPLDPFPAVPESPLPPTRVETPSPTRTEPPAAPQPPTFTHRPPIAAQPAPPAPAAASPVPASPVPASPVPASPVPPSPVPASPVPAGPAAGPYPAAGSRPVTGPPLPPKPAKQRRRDRKAAKRQAAPPTLPTGRPQAGAPGRPQAGAPGRPQAGAPSRPQAGAPSRPPAGGPGGPPGRGPLPAPPPWAPRQPARPLPPPPRRKRRWGRRLALFSLLSVACCCGAPFAAYRLSSAQYPVTAVLPESFADLQLRDTQDTGADSFAGEYKDDRGKRVTVFGTTGFRLNPGDDVGAHLEQVADEYKLSDVREFDLGEFGAHESCGVGRDDGATVVVCAWADHGSLATVLLTRRSVQDSADLVARLREAVLTRG